MGQCSTLPTEAKHADSSTSAMDQSSQRQHQQQQQQQHRKDTHMTTQDSENSTTPLTQQYRRRPSGYTAQVESPEEVAPPVKPGLPPMSPPAVTPQQRQTTCTTPQPMQEEREAPAAPPDCAIKARCYRLNLESDYVGIHASSSPRYEGQCFGPFLDTAPPLTRSASADSCESQNATSVAIRTAQIFRGISIAKDGTILSMNARASRSNRNSSKTKRGEKSRQAAKIDKAKDLVEESVLTGKNGDDQEAKMLSLFVVGEYDEMKQLVRDGAKKLRDAHDLPDDVLLSVNRERGSAPSPVLSPSSRKRVSPYGLQSPYHHSPKSPSSKARHTPKLKAHPRDSRREENSTRQSSRRGFSPMNDPCSQLSDSDWSASLGLSRGFNSIWNCGASGMSPTEKAKQQRGGFVNSTSPRQQKPQMEGRNESSYRGTTGFVERVEPPELQV